MRRKVVPMNAYLAIKDVRAAHPIRLAANTIPTLATNGPDPFLVLQATNVPTVRALSHARTRVHPVPRDVPAAAIKLALNFQADVTAGVQRPVVLRVTNALTEVVFVPVRMPAQAAPRDVQVRDIRLVPRAQTDVISGVRQ